MLGNSVSVKYTITFNRGKLWLWNQKSYLEFIFVCRQITSLSCSTHVPKHVRAREMSIFFSHLLIELIELKRIRLNKVLSVTNHPEWHGKKNPRKWPLYLWVNGSNLCIPVSSSSGVFEGGLFEGYIWTFSNTAVLVPFVSIVYEHQVFTIEKGTFRQILTVFIESTAGQNHLIKQWMKANLIN